MKKSFYFQAEDGIRYVAVTGVQTCALPIARSARPCPAPPESRSRRDARSHRRPVPSLERSEERRVGKERSSPWSRDSGRKRKMRAVETALGCPHLSTL